MAIVAVTQVLTTCDCHQTPAGVWLCQTSSLGYLRIGLGSLTSMELVACYLHLYLNVPSTRVGEVTL